MWNRINTVQRELSPVFILPAGQYVDSETIGNLTYRLQELLEPTVRGSVYRIGHSYNTADMLKAIFGFRGRMGGDANVPADCYSFMITPIWSWEEYFHPHVLYEGFRIFPTAMRCIHASDEDVRHALEKALKVIHDIIVELLKSGEHTLSTRAT